MVLPSTVLNKNYDFLSSYQNKRNFARIREFPDCCKSLLVDKRKWTKVWFLSSEGIKVKHGQLLKRRSYSLEKSNYNDSWSVRSNVSISFQNEDEVYHRNVGTWKATVIVAASFQTASTENLLKLLTEQFKATSASEFMEIHQIASQDLKGVWFFWVNLFSQTWAVLRWAQMDDSIHTIQ